MHPTQPSLKLAHYFWIEGLNGFAGVLFLNCAFFWARARFGYTATENLLLSSTHGLIYIFATKYGGKLSDRIGYDRLLSICVLAAAFCLLFGWIPSWHIFPFILVTIYTVFFAPTWPTLEAAILHSPGTTSMPDRLGLYNVTWALFGGLGFAVSATLFSWNPDSIVWIPGLFYLFQWAWLRWAPRNILPSTTAIPHRGDHIALKVKRHFVYTAWLGNSLAFLMIASFFALTPFFGERLQLSSTNTILLASTLLFARTIGFLVLWKWNGWHYHMTWSQSALWIAPLCLIVAFFSNHLIIIFVALFVLGLAAGVSYSGSIYYSLDYGNKKAEHGGNHESILGIGIFIGPLLAAIASSISPGTFAAQWTIIGLALSANVIGSIAIRRLNSTFSHE